MERITTAVIQAGGKGTRLRELTKDEIPKPLLPMNGKPMMEWQLLSLADYGVSEFIFIIGHLGEKVKAYFEDGSSWGVRIEYIEEDQPLGSAGALYFLKDRLRGRDFFLIFGDVMFNMDMNRMMDFHLDKSGLATLVVHPNAHPYDSDLVVLNQDSQVVGFDSKNNNRDYWYDNCVNAGIYVLSGEILDRLTIQRRVDMEKDLIVPLLDSKRIFGYRTPEYVKDAGTVNRFLQVESDFSNGVAERKNLRNRQRCIFLDRDGTINQYNGFISCPETFELEDCAGEAVALINNSGYLAIVITNQPVVARGACTIEELESIHKKMTSLLGEKGAYLDDIVYCPHHPDRGYPGENAAYKISCECRKPKTGLVEEMIEKYHIDREKSYFVGDSTIDIQTGLNAGLHTVLVRTGLAGKDGKYNVNAEYVAENLLEAVDEIVRTGT